MESSGGAFITCWPSLAKGKELGVFPCPCFHLTNTHQCPLPSLPAPWPWTRGACVAGASLFWRSNSLAFPDRAGGGPEPWVDLGPSLCRGWEAAHSGWRSPALQLGEMDCRQASEEADGRALGGSRLAFSAPQITGSWGSLKMNTSLGSPPSSGSIHFPLLAQAFWGPLYLVLKVLGGPLVHPG